MGEHKYNIQLAEIDKRNIIQGLLKVITEKAEVIVDVCEEGKTDGQVYDSELKTIEIVQADINQLKNTLEILHNAEVISSAK